MIKDNDNAPKFEKRGPRGAGAARVAAWGSMRAKGLGEMTQEGLAERRQGPARPGPGVLAMTVQRNRNCAREAQL
jgi:hypothetical protein